MNFFYKPSFKIPIYFGFSTLILFLSFFVNLWKVADENWFRFQNYDMESFILGRLVKSQQDGIFSSGGLTGIGSWNTILMEYDFSLFEYQYQAYFTGEDFKSYLPYYSQIGGQGILFSILDQSLPFLSYIKIGIYRALSSFITSIIIALVVLWFYFEFGFMISLFVLISTIFSPWLTVFGGKLWWQTWSFYLPMVVIIYYLKDRKFKNLKIIRFGVLVFISIFIKCLFTGYEYITTTLVMMVVPLVFYGVKRGITFREFVTCFIVSIICSFIAIFLSLLILAIQISSIDGNLLTGVQHIVISLGKRTYGDPANFAPEYFNSLTANTILVLATYLNGGYFGPIEYLPNSNQLVAFITSRISYLFLILLFGFFSIIFYIISQNFPDLKERRTGFALISSLWFSILAPLSWFVLFKAHSFIHTHMNYIVWQMPFTIFGFATCGFTIQVLNNLRSIRKGRKFLSK